MEKNFLLEIGTEEMPARFLPTLLSQLRELLEENLRKERLPFGRSQTYGTPRRLVAFVWSLAGVQEPFVQEIRGPSRQQAFEADGRPTRAAIGFARAYGVSVDDLQIRDTGRGEFVFVVRQMKGESAHQVLKRVVPEVIRALSFPKTMRWESSNLRFGRPIRWIVALLGDDQIPFEVAGVPSSRQTYGRRLAGGSLKGPTATIPSADDYWRVTDQLGIVVDPEKRRQAIQTLVLEEAERLKGEADLDQALLEEVTHLVETPYALSNFFDQRFLSLPPLLLKTVMKHHQRYFPVTARGNKDLLLPAFIVICNGKPEDEEKVRDGNRKVLEARFEDAEFSLIEDSKASLEEMGRRLSQIVFQEEIGTMADKRERLKQLMVRLAERLHLDPQKAVRAAELCKADLSSRLVNEFPELQGWVGAFYAKRQGEAEDVVLAIEDHYKPLTVGSPGPRNELGFALALADRLDTLVACFDRNLVPTGSHDPLALRRAGSTLVQLLAEAAYRPSLSLSELVDDALEVLTLFGLATADRRDTKERLILFLANRLETLFEEEGIDHDIRRAVIEAGFDSVRDAVWRARTLQGRRRDDPAKFSAAVTAFTRVTNILLQARQRGEKVKERLDPQTLAEQQERALWAAVQKTATSVNESLESHNFDRGWAGLTQLAEPINNFFDNVLIMHPEETIRHRRLALLRQIEFLLLRFADFRMLEG